MNNAESRNFEIKVGLNVFITTLYEIIKQVAAVQAIRF